MQAEQDVMLERVAQLEEFPSILDDRLEPSEWVARITKHVGRAVTMDPATYRQELVIVGALALAAIDAYDRKFA